MLTKMPKVGDVVIAKVDAESKFEYVTAGDEYIVKAVDEDDCTWFEDAVGAARCIIFSELGCFTLKSEAQTDEPVGSIKELELETTEVNTSNLQAKFHIITLSVDDVGLASVRKLASQSDKGRRRNHIQAKIDALQAELNAL